MPQRATYAEINLNAFRGNLRTVKTALGPEVGVLAVVKADAYGHGAVPCAQAAVEVGADWLGVGIVQEGIELRESGLSAPILVLGSVFPNEVEALIQHDLSTVLTTHALADALEKAAAQAGKTVGVHVKVDTGMGRLGATMEDFPSLLERVGKSKNLVVQGVSTHFSCADEEDPEYTRLQISRFREVLERAEKSGLDVPYIHSANSAAMIKYPETWHNLTRPGLILYGALLSEALIPFAESFAKGVGGFQPVMQWKSRIIQVNTLPPGAGLSYGKTQSTRRESRIATLPLGYADGLARNLSNKMHVLVRGRRTPQVGNICMDMILIDVTEVPEAREGDEVVIIGTQGEESIRVEEVAAQSGTLPYETLCAVGKRVPRVYLS